MHVTLFSPRKHTHFPPQRPCARYAPTLEEIGQALDSLQTRGVPLPADPKAEIWTLLLERGYSRPLRAMAIAASFSIESVCVPTSRLTLSMTLDRLTEADALMMGSIHLRRLYFLHTGRRQGLHRVIKDPPQEHPPKRHCSREAHEDIVREWNLVVAGLVIDPGSVGTTTSRIDEAFGALTCGRHCTLCINGIRGRVAEVCREWLAIKDTI